MLVLFLNGIICTELKYNLFIFSLVLILNQSWRWKTCRKILKLKIISILLKVFIFISFGSALEITEICIRSDIEEVLFSSVSTSLTYFNFLTEVINITGNMESILRLPGDILRISMLWLITYTLSKQLLDFKLDF